MRLRLLVVSPGAARGVSRSGGAAAAIVCSSFGGAAKPAAVPAATAGREQQDGQQGEQHATAKHVSLLPY